MTEFEEWFITVKSKNPSIPPYDDWYVGMEQAFIAGRIKGYSLGYSDGNATWTGDNE